MYTSSQISKASKSHISCKFPYMQNMACRHLFAPWRDLKVFVVIICSAKNRWLKDLYVQMLGEKSDLRQKYLRSKFKRHRLEWYRNLWEQTSVQGRYNLVTKLPSSWMKKLPYWDWTRCTYVCHYFFFHLTLLFFKQSM